MEKRYRVLRFVATMFQVLGWLVLIFGVLGGLGTCLLGLLGVLGGAALAPDPRAGDVAALLAGMGVLGGILVGLLTILYSVITGLAIIAAGQLVYVLVDIEENTRAVRIGQGR